MGSNQIVVSHECSATQKTCKLTDETVVATSKDSRDHDFGPTLANVETASQDHYECRYGQRSEYV